MKINVETADNFFEKTRGLMFRRKFDKALLFTLKKKTRIGAAIHSLFVFFPFDVVWLDENKMIVDLKESVKPFSLNIFPKKECNYILELPEGLIKKYNLKIGKKISLTYKS